MIKQNRRFNKKIKQNKKFKENKMLESFQLTPLQKNKYK